MKRARAAIDGGTFAEFRRQFVAGYQPREAA
jgi:queuine/archaeosine tRNA-ribosyltransferase